MDVVSEAKDLITQTLDEPLEFGHPAAEDIQILVRWKPDVLVHRLSKGVGGAVAPRLMTRRRRRSSC
ncbi:hypothetical protein GCM10020220_068750 [Nonomuraea rubra]